MTDLASSRRRGRPQQFFSRLGAEFDTAADGRLISRFIRFGSDSIQLRFAGPRLVDDVMPALHHQETEPVASPDLSVDIWDTITTGVSPGPPPWGAYDYLARGEIRGYNCDGYRTSYRLDSGILTMMSLEAGRAVFWIRDAAYYPGWMRAAPLRNIFGWWATWRQCQLIHGAAVGDGDAALLLSAPGGSGKSTTAVRAAFDGMAYLGDDYVLVDPRRPAVYSLYGSLKLDEAAIRLFAPDALSRSRGLVGEPPHQKHFFLGEDLFATPVASGHHLTGLVVPSVGHDEATARTEVSEAQALAAVAPTTLFQLEGSSNEEFASLALLVRRLPIFGLEVGREPVAPILRRLIEEAAR